MSKQPPEPQSESTSLDDQPQSSNPVMNIIIAVLVCMISYQVWLIFKKSEDLTAKSTKSTATQNSRMPNQPISATEANKLADELNKMKVLEIAGDSPKQQFGGEPAGLPRLPYGTRIWGTQQQDARHLEYSTIWRVEKQAPGKIKEFYAPHIAKAGYELTSDNTKNNVINLIYSKAQDYLILRINPVGDSVTVSLMEINQRPPLGR